MTDSMILRPYQSNEKSAAGRRGPYHVDAPVKFDWLDGDDHSDAVSVDGDMELRVFGLSPETGYRPDLT
jgi:hypothetical protein